MLQYFEKLVDPYEEDRREKLPETFVAFMWACAKGARGYLLAITLLTAAIGALEAALFSVVGKLVDKLGKANPQTLWTDHASTLWLIVGLVLASIVVVLFQATIKHQTIMGNFPMRQRWMFHNRMLNQSMSFYSNEFAGRIATKVMQTALAVRDAWMTISDVLVYATIYFATLVIGAASFDWRLALPFLAWLVAYVAACSFFVPRLGRIAKSQADARSLMTGRVTDAYTNIATVKLFSHAKREATYVKSAMQEFMGTVYTQWRLITQLDVVHFALTMMLVLGVSATALWLWSKGDVGLGALAAASAMSLRLNGMSNWIMWELAGLFEQVGTVKDGIDTLAKQQTIVDAPDAKPLAVTRGEVRFDNVTFTYGATSAKPVLDQFSLQVKPGEKIGLVGRSGAGKSTIVNLLLRFYDIEKGAITIDNTNIAHVTQDTLREQIGMVTQDTSLLHRSVRENIVYGRPDATDAEMMSAAKRAEADAFIDTLVDPKGNKGYDAHVGERGVKLSGGQRQRVAIARVMLKDAPILVLDEATSALDSEVEAAIQTSLYRLMEGKTVIAIAHRLSTIAAMDRLIVLDEGCVIEEGDHKTLLEKNGIYAKLWAHQSGGFLGEK
jgi:ATP-binding cassette, subfamily B, multidrug efflux pump